MKGTAGHQNRPSFPEIIRWLTERIAKSIGCPPEDIDVETPLEGIGLSSRDALGLSGELEEWLECRMEPTLLLDYPTITAVARHLAGETPASSKPTHPHQNNMDPVAIVGMACRFPGAPDKDAYWRLMMEGQVVLQPWPQERLRLTGHRLKEDAGPDVRACYQGGFIDGIETFDAEFFQIAPRETAFMDPRQRIMLETVWTALEDAGWLGETLSGSYTGVYMAAGQGEYVEDNLSAFKAAALSDLMGAPLCVIANRVSYFLGLRGPSLTLDAACAGSLYAVHLAGQALQRREIDAAIVGSVNIMLDPEAAIPLAKAGLLSPDGSCRPLDARANGYVHGEGCGVTVLRRLDDALKNREHIYAVIRGSASGHTGHGLSITSPSTGAYADVFRNALATGSVDPHEVGYIEAHGAALPHMDLMEVHALTSAGILDTRSFPCYIGSHKSNIGNSEVAAGMAGLIRTALILERGMIPPQASFQAPDSRFPVDKNGLAVAQAPVTWLTAGTKRFAAVLSQGLAGANAALVLEEAPRECADHAEPVPNTYGFLLSAKTPHALRTLARRIADALEIIPRESLRNACMTIHHRRTRFACRVVISGADRESLVARLREVASDPGAAMTAGLETDTETIPEDTGPFRLIPLPGYPFERTRHWLEPERKGKISNNRQDNRPAMGPARNSGTSSLSLTPEFLESYLRKTIADVLQLPLEKITVDEHFITLGLNSLLAMDVISRCSSDLQLVLYPRDFLECPSIGHMAALVASRTGGAPAPEIRALDFFGWRVSHAKDAAQFNSISKNRPMIFLLSAPRSGSTLLRVMLAGHSRLFCPPELHLLPYDTLEERARALRDTDLGEGLSSALRTLFPQVDHERPELLESWQKDNLGVREVYKRLQDAAVPKQLVDKSPTYAGAREILERAEALFENPLYIYLVRHPYSVIESFVRTGMDRYLYTRASDPYQTAELVWSVSNRNLAEFLETIPEQRRCRLHYERLVAAPRQTMEALCAFLGIPFEDALLHPYVGERMTRDAQGKVPAVGDPNFLTHSKIMPELGEAWKHVILPRILSVSSYRLAETLGYSLPEARQPSSCDDFEESRL